MNSFFEQMIGRFSKKKTESTVKDESLVEENNRKDPLDRTDPNLGWKPGQDLNPIRKTVEDFPIYEASEGNKLVLVKDTTFVADAKVIKSVKVADDAMESGGISEGTGQVPILIQQWYMSQGFIGYQACALIAQHWLVDKACSQSGEDAIRNGWFIKASGEGVELSKEQHDKIVEADKPFRLKQNLSELNRFKNIFGIRVAVFEVDSDDVLYYEKPFNIDGVTEGSYKGISQVDPYWMTPMLTTQSTSDPANRHFYDPEYWIISGKKYHRSHLVIALGPQPADILKPTYIFGGIPMTQRIYERVYAAERTANEAPLLAMNKRTTAIHVDLEKVAMNEAGFVKRLMMWVKYRDNHAVKVLGKEETMEQFDTNLSDFDSVIMNQYQIVAAISKTPATKLLGTSPKGFNATGEFESISYNEELESTQEHTMQPLLDRHYLLLAKSMRIEAPIKAVFHPVDSLTAAQQAEINAKKAETGQTLINSGAISPDEERNRVQDDENSGYNRLTDSSASEEAGMSPENIAALQKAGAQQEEGQGEEMRGSAAVTTAGGKPATLPAPSDPASASNPTRNDTQGDDETPAADPTPSGAPENQGEIAKQLKALIKLLSKTHNSILPEGIDNIGEGEGVTMTRTSKPGTGRSIAPTVAGIRSVSASADPIKLPKIKVAGLIVSVENPKGTVRKGMGLNGKPWAAKMPNHYGFINGTLGADGEEIDAFVGPNLQSPIAYVINQRDDSGNFDEHKVLLGFNSEEDAKNAYLAAHSSGWNGMGDIVEMSIPELKQWLANGNGEAPLSQENLAQSGSQPENQ